jgi:hypothetical protein
MNFKTTYVLFGVLIVMIGLLAVVLYKGPTESQAAEYVFPEFHGKEKSAKVDDIDKVVIERKKPSDSDIVFERGEDKNWRMTSPRALPTESSSVARLVDAITDARVDDQTKVESLKEGGLDSPTRIITLTGNGVDLKLTIGDTTPGQENAVTYVLSSARPKKPAAVRKSNIESALENVPYFRSKNLLGDSSTDVRGVKLTLGKKGTVELRKEKDHWRMVQPPYGDADISNLLNNITGLTVHYSNDKESDFVEDSAKDLAKYHLDPAKAEVLRIEVTRGDAKKTTTTAALVGVNKKLGDAKDAKDAKPLGGEKYYAALDEGQTKDVVKVPASNVDPIVKLVEDPGALRNKHLVQLENFKTPDAIDVTNSYGTLEFRKPDAIKPWELHRGGTASKVDEAEVRQLIDALTKTDATSFPDPKRKKELGLEKPDVVVRLWADSLEKADEKKEEKKEEKKDGKSEKAGAKKVSKPAFKKGAEPAAELRFGNAEGTSVAVERVWGKESAIVMVPLTVRDTVRKGPLAYYDKSIPPFNLGSAEEDVTKVEITRSGETLEITREKSTDPWKLTKPAALKRRKASEQVVREILNDLNRLTAKEVVAEKADKSVLAKEFDLAQPPYRVAVTITKDKKSTTHTFDLGKEVAGKGIYLKLGDKDTVYLVGAEVLTAIKKELRDTTVFDFDPDKVVSLKLTGWKKLLGSPHTRTLEKKDKTWTCKEQKDFKVDDTKVTSLLAGLAHLKAERFVQSGKGLKPDEDAFQIEITMDDKKVYDLTVGAQEGNSYFATSNQLKGDVFLVAKDLFEEARKAPGYFSK